MENKNDFWLNWSQNWSYNFSKLSNAIGRKLIDAGLKLKMVEPYAPYGIDPYDELGYDKIEDSRFPKLKSSEWEKRAMLESGERDARENFKERMQRQNRFTVYGNNMIKKRFKVTEQESGVRGTGRMRVAGQTFDNNMIEKRFKVTEQQSGIREKGRLRTSGKTFNQNIRRNPNFNDIIIP